MQASGSDRLRALVWDLRADDRILLEFRIVDRWRYADIADHLGVPRGVLADRCTACRPTCGGRRGRTDAKGTLRVRSFGGQGWARRRRSRWRPGPRSRVPARLEAALPLDRAKETLAVESEVPVGATRQCLVSVLSRRAKTSFPGRGPLRYAPGSFPPGVFSRVSWPGLRPASTSAYGSSGSGIAPGLARHHTGDCPWPPLAERCLIALLRGDTVPLA